MTHPSADVHAPGWQPIETAPKDCPILLFSKYDGIAICQWRGDGWRPQADGNDAIEYMSDFGTEYLQFSVPTHWQSLPEPPK